MQAKIQTSLLFAVLLLYKAVGQHQSSGIVSPIGEDGPNQLANDDPFAKRLENFATASHTKTQDLNTKLRRKERDVVEVPQLDISEEAFNEMLRDAMTTTTELPTTVAPKKRRGKGRKSQKIRKAAAVM